MASRNTAEFANRHQDDSPASNTESFPARDPSLSEYENFEKVAQYAETATKQFFNDHELGIYLNKRNSTDPDGPTSEWGRKLADHLMTDIRISSTDHMSDQQAGVTNWIQDAQKNTVASKASELIHDGNTRNFNENGTAIELKDASDVLETIGNGQSFRERTPDEKEALHHTLQDSRLLEILDGTKTDLTERYVDEMLKTLATKFNEMTLRLKYSEDENEQAPENVLHHTSGIQDAIFRESANIQEVQDHRKLCSNQADLQYRQDPIKYVRDGELTDEGRARLELVRDAIETMPDIPQAILEYGGYSAKEYPNTTNRLDRWQEPQFEEYTSNGHKILESVEHHFGQDSELASEIRALFDRTQEHNASWINPDSPSRTQLMEAFTKFTDEEKDATNQYQTANFIMYHGAGETISFISDLRDGRTAAQNLREGETFDPETFDAIAKTYMNSLSRTLEGYLEEAADALVNGNREAFDAALTGVAIAKDMTENLITDGIPSHIVESNSMGWEIEGLKAHRFQNLFSEMTKQCSEAVGLGDRFRMNYDTMLDDIANSTSQEVTQAFGDFSRRQMQGDQELLTIGMTHVIMDRDGEFERIEDTYQAELERNNDFGAAWNAKKENTKQTIQDVRSRFTQAISNSE